MSTSLQVRYYDRRVSFHSKWLF